MKKEHVYYVMIALGVLAPTIYVLYTIGGGLFAKNLESPAVLEEKVLHGSSVEERVAAAKGLIQHGAAARKEIRRALGASHDSDPEVRVYLLQAVTVIKDWRSLPEIFAAMEDPDVTVRSRAAAAAMKIMYSDSGFRAEDPPEKRKKVLATIRRDPEYLERKYKKFYPDQKE